MAAGVTNFAPAVDAHHHLWDAIQNKYPYLTDGSRTRMHGKPLPLRYSIDDYRRDIGGLNVEKSVHIQCGWDPADPVGETRWLESIAQAHGYPHAIVAHADLSAPDIEAVLAAHAMASPRLRGIRQHVGWHENPRYRLGPRSSMMNEAAWRRGFAMLGKFQLSFDLQAFYTQFGEASDLAKKFPETTIVLGNSGMPVDRDPASLNGWREALRRASACPNICIKIGGFSMVDHDWSVATIRPFVDAMINAFGVERCMIGSNFPTDSLYRDFKPMWLAYQEVTANLTTDERDHLFRRTATRIYRLDD